MDPVVCFFTRFPPFTALSLFGLINRGLGPMGSFPFGLIATVIGARWTVSVCGVLTVLLVGYVMLFRSHLCHARPLGEM
jgi:hypothetical protein